MEPSVLHDDGRETALFFFFFPTRKNEELPQSDGSHSKVLVLLVFGFGFLLFASFFSMNSTIIFICLGLKDVYSFNLEKRLWRRNVEM